MPRGTTDYPNLGEYLHPSYANLSDKRIEALLARNNMGAEDMEGFLDALSKFASTAGQALVQAARHYCRSLEPSPSGVLDLGRKTVREFVLRSDPDAAGRESG